VVSLIWYYSFIDCCLCFCLILGFVWNLCLASRVVTVAGLWGAQRLLFASRPDHSGSADWAVADPLRPSHWTSSLLSAVCFVYCLSFSVIVRTLTYWNNLFIESVLVHYRHRIWNGFESRGPTPLRHSQQEERWAIWNWKLEDWQLEASQPLKSRRHWAVSDRFGCPL